MKLKDAHDSFSALVDREKKTAYTIWFWFLAFFMTYFIDGKPKTGFTAMLFVVTPTLVLYVNCRRKIALLPDQELERYLVRNVIGGGLISLILVMYFASVALRCTADAFKGVDHTILHDKDNIDFDKECGGLYLSQLSLSYMVALTYVFGISAGPITEWNKLSRNQLLSLDVPPTRLKMQLFLLLACVLTNLYLAGGLYLKGEKGESLGRA